MWQRDMWVFVGIMGCVPVSLSAQTWHLPRLLPPQVGHEIAVHGIDTAPWGSLTDHWAVAADWRRSGAVNLGVRLGYQNYGLNVSPAERYVAGLSTWYQFLHAEAPAMIDAAVTGGVGAAFGDGSPQFNIPIGISIARPIPFRSVALVPYVHPFIAPELPGFSLDTGWGADVGADLRFRTLWALRGGITFGGDESLGLGIVWNLQR